MKKLIVANWKNHPDTLAEAEQILDSTDEYLGSLSENEKFGLVFCPPFVFVEEVAKMLGTSHLLHYSELGAQDLAVDGNSSVTGEITGEMLLKFGTRYVIVGHSERRWKLGESDEVVNQKLKTALKKEFVPIVCVGERERDGNFKEFLKNQVQKTFSGLSSDEIERCFVAYEPVWAISTTPGARPDTPQSALESVDIIQEVLGSEFEVKTPKFLYGGSVTSANAEEFLINDCFSGVLVGGASLKKDEFIKILSVAFKL